MDGLGSSVDPELVVSLVLHVIGVSPKLLLKLFTRSNLEHFIFINNRFCNLSNFLPIFHPDEVEGLIVSVLLALNHICYQNRGAIV